MKKRLAASLIATTFAVLGTAPLYADVSPPPGTKSVGYSFKVESSDALKDYVLLALRCDGGTHDALMVVEGGTAQKIGRHGGLCSVYSMKKDEYETWKKDTKLTGDWSDPALDALAKDGRVHHCSGGPTPVFTLPTEDSRSEVSDVLKIQKLDDKTCAFASVSGPSSPTASPSSSSGPSSSASPSSNPSSSSTPPESASRGCGGCAVAEPSSSETGAVVAMALLAGAIGVRSRRRRSS